MSTALLAFVTSLLATACYRPLGRRWQQLDAPNARSAHQRPVLSSGGIAIISALALALALGHWRAQPALAPREQLMLGLALLLCLGGAIDDRHSLPVWLRLLFFLAIACLTVALYHPPMGIAMLLQLGLLALALAWVINLFNFMDGIDGIAALQCVITAGAMALLGYWADAALGFIVVSLSVAAVFGAFLCFNWPPAALFMGDAGSLPGGFLLAWLGLWGWSLEVIAPQSWLLLMSPFLIDTAYTLCARLLRGERITQAHSEHIYQRLARRWQSHRRVDLALLLLHGLWLLPLLFAQAAGVIGPGLALAFALAPQILVAPVLVARDSQLQ